MAAAAAASDQQQYHILFSGIAGTIGMITGTCDELMSGKTRDVSTFVLPVDKIGNLCAQPETSNVAFRDYDTGTTGIVEIPSMTVFELPALASWAKVRKSATRSEAAAKDPMVHLNMNMAFSPNGAYFADSVFDRDAVQVYCTRGPPKNWFHFAELLFTHRATTEKRRYLDLVFSSNSKTLVISDTLFIGLYRIFDNSRVVNPRLEQLCQIDIEPLNLLYISMFTPPEDSDDLITIAAFAETSKKLAYYTWLVPTYNTGRRSQSELALRFLSKSKRENRTMASFLKHSKLVHYEGVLYKYPDMSWHDSLAPSDLLSELNETGILTDSTGKEYIIFSNGSRLYISSVGSKSQPTLLLDFDISITSIAIVKANASVPEADSISADAHDQATPNSSDAFPEDLELGLLHQDMLAISARIDDGVTENLETATKATVKHLNSLYALVASAKTMRRMTSDAKKLSGTKDRSRFRSATETIRLVRKTRQQFDKEVSTLRRRTIDVVDAMVSDLQSKKTTIIEQLDSMTSTTRDRLHRCDGVAAIIEENGQASVDRFRRAISSSSPDSSIVLTLQDLICVLDHYSIVHKMDLLSPSIVKEDTVLAGVQLDDILAMCGDLSTTYYTLQQAIGLHAVGDAVRFYMALRAAVAPPSEFRLALARASFTSSTPTAAAAAADDVGGSILYSNLPCILWSVEHVAQWLAANDFESLQNIVLEHRISGEMLGALMMLFPHMLDTMGNSSIQPFTVAQRIKVAAALRGLNDAPPACLLDVPAAMLAAISSHQESSSTSSSSSSSFSSSSMEGACLLMPMEKEEEEAILSSLALDSSIKTTHGL
jgi:hypothetical protein